MKEKPTNNNIAVICDDLTEFFVIRGAIDKLIELKIPVDIIIPFDSGYNGLPEHTIKAIKKLGYSPKNDTPKNKQYKILLTPYPGLNVVQRTNFVYHIRFPYSAISAKPNPVYLPSTYLDYDLILSFNTYDQDFLNAYGGKVHPIPYWRYHNFKKESLQTSKPVLLILPTFGADTSSINDFTDTSIKALKEKYYIITKAHHAIHFGLDGTDTIDVLKSMADEYYDSDTPIDDLLKKADLVLSDNSGAIFESICAGIPVALFAKNLNSRHLKSIDTPQQRFVDKKIIPHTNDPKKILPMLLSIDNFAEKQKTLRDQLFLKTSKNPYQEFIDIIKEYLSKDQTKDYHKILHDILVNDWYDYKRKIQTLEETNQSLNQSIKNLQNSTSWKVTKPLRKLSSIIHGETNV